MLKKLGWTLKDNAKERLGYALWGSMATVLLLVGLYFILWDVNNQGRGEQLHYPRIEWNSEGVDHYRLVAPEGWLYRVAPVVAPREYVKQGEMTSGEILLGWDRDFMPGMVYHVDILRPGGPITKLEFQHPYLSEVGNEVSKIQGLIEGPVSLVPVESPVVTLYSEPTPIEEGQLEDCDIWYTVDVVESAGEALRAALPNPEKEGFCFQWANE